MADGEASYRKDQMLDAYLAGMQNELPSTSHTVLSSLEALNKFQLAIDSKDDSKLAKKYRPIAEDEVKWLGRAADALAADPSLKDKFGAGYSGLVDISGVLRKMHAEEKAHAMLRGHAWRDDDKVALQKRQAAWK
jgi:hypothetical protein